MTSAAPTRLHRGRFELRRELGQGGTGTVFAAWDALRERAVALKQLNHVDPQSLYLLKNEFRSAAELTHENLVRLGELFAEGGAVFFTMELLEGVDFLSYVRSTDLDSQRDVPTQVRPRREQDPSPRSSAPPPPNAPAFDEAALRASLRQLFTGLHALHALGLVHRDVKPSNALVERGGRLVLLDFGLTAEVRAHREGEHGWIVGTPRYMAPEQVRNAAVGPAADSYAAGVMLHEALVGRPPIDGSAREIMFGKQLSQVGDLSERFPFVPPDLGALCAELLRIDPAGRPSDEEVLRRLGASVPELVTGAAREVFVGRERELRGLARAHEEARDRPVVVVVRGESGVGKTTLVQRFVEQLRRAHPPPRVLRGRCYERENIPFNAIDAVVDSLSHQLAADDDPESARSLGDARDLAALARIFPVLRRSRAIEWIVMDHPLPDASPQELRLRAFRALERLLAPQQAGPVVVTIDDLQWADGDSLALLDELTSGPSQLPLLVAATPRPGGSLGPLARGERDLRVIDLAGLEEGEAAALVERLASECPPKHARALAREAEGHPLYLLELVRSIERGDARPSLDDSLRSRAEGLSPDIRQVLDLIAVAGMPLRQGLLAEAAGVGVSECLAAIDTLRRALFVRTDGTGAEDLVEPYHDRVREALAAALPSAARAAAHLRLADALERSVLEPRERATLVHHLEQAGERARAARHAERAAAELAHALAFDGAADMYARALRLGDHGEQDRARLMLACGYALRDAGRGSEAAERFVEAARSQAEDERLTLEVAAAEQWVACGHLDRGLGLLEDVLGRLGVRWPRTQPDVLASFLLERAKLAARGLEQRGRARIDRDERRRLEVFQSIASGLGSIDPLRAWVFQTRALRRILETDERDLLAVGLSLEALLLGLEGEADVAEVRRLVARAEELALGSESPRVSAWARLADGGTSYFLGRFASAPGPLAEAEALFRDDVRVDAGGLNVTRVLKVWTAVFRGDLGQLAAWIPEYERDARRRDDRYAQVSLNLAGHVGWLVDGDLARARTKVAERAWRPPGGGYHIQSWYELLAECEQALYAAAGGEPLDEALRARVDRGFRALRRSLVFLRSAPIRVYGTWLNARYLLACASQGVERRRALRGARALAKRLASERVGLAAIPYAAAVRAGCAALEGDHERARVELRVCIELAEQASLFGVAAIARRRMGWLAGSASHREAAERWFRAQGVADAVRMSGMYLPGFAG